MSAQTVEEARERVGWAFARWYGGTGKAVENAKRPDAALDDYAAAIRVDERERGGGGMSEQRRLTDAEKAEIERQVREGGEWSEEQTAEGFKRIVRTEQPVEEARVSPERPLVGLEGWENWQFRSEHPQFGETWISNPVHPAVRAAIRAEAQREREAEVERLREELADAKAALAEILGMTEPLGYDGGHLAVAAAARAALGEGADVEPPPPLPR